MPRQMTSNRSALKTYRDSIEATWACHSKRPESRNKSDAAHQSHSRRKGTNDRCSGNEGFVIAFCRPENVVNRKFVFFAFMLAAHKCSLRDSDDLGIDQRLWFSLSKNSGRLCRRRSRITDRSTSVPSKTNSFLGARAWVDNRND